MEPQTQTPTQTPPASTDPVSQTPPTPTDPASSPTPTPPKTSLLPKIALIVLGLIVLAAVAVAAYYLGTKKVNPLYPSPSPISSVSPTATASASPTSSPASGMLYTNTQYGFSFTLPETWKSYTVSSDPGPDPRIVRLTVPSPISGSLPVSSLSVYMFTKAEWQTHDKKPQYLTENDQYIFATDHYITSKDECVQLDEFQCARVLEVPSIMATFKLQ